MDAFACRFRRVVRSARGGFQDGGGVGMEEKSAVPLFPQGGSWICCPVSASKAAVPRGSLLVPQSEPSPGHLGTAVRGFMGCMHPL